MNVHDPITAHTELLGRRPRGTAAQAWADVEAQVRFRERDQNLRLVRCKSCHAIGYWRDTPDGHSLRNVTGEAHNSTCPHAEKWRKSSLEGSLADRLEKARADQERETVRELLQTLYTLAHFEHLEAAGEHWPAQIDFAWEKVEELAARLPPDLELEKPVEACRRRRP